MKSVQTKIRFSLSKIILRRVLIIWAAAMCGGAVEAEIAITADYDNSHISTKFSGVKQEHDTVTLDFGSYSTDRELWFNFKITGCKGREVTFLEATNAQPGFRVVRYKEPTEPFATPYELTETHVKGVWKHKFREDTAYGSFAYPAPNAMVDHYIAQIKDNPYVEVRSLGQSTFFGLDMPLLLITDKSVPDKDKKVVYLTSREDSYEADGTLAILGAIKYLLSDDPMAQEIRKKCLYVVVPIFSRDGAKIGATNWPLKNDNSKFTYFPLIWKDNEEGIKEIELLKSFFEAWKKDGKVINAFHSLHCAPYWQCGLYFRPNPNDPESKPRLQAYLDSVRNRCLRHYTILTNPPGEKYMFRWLQERFPAIVGGNAHVDSIVPAEGRRPVEDLYEDGELFVRADAEYFGVPIPKETPPFLFAGGASLICGKPGDPVTYHVFYRDILGRDATEVRLVVGAHAYAMKKVASETNKDGDEYQCIVPLGPAANDYYMEASNGVRKRRIPENYRQLGPYIAP